MSNVPLHTDILGSLLDKVPESLKALGRLETSLLKYDIIDLNIEKPIFVTGLARAGTTILLEILNSHPDVVSYHYGDYPFVHANYFWNTLKKLTPSNTKKIERAHKDRIMINMNSPEALDEILWMSYFENIHDPKLNNILNKETQNTDFESFYKDSLLKLLALRNGKRIALKNNYHISRIEYLHKIFPDARFIIPIRPPEEHIYSLIKQHKLLSKAQQNDKRGSRYMRRHGHHEFGSDFRPINLNNPEKTDEILQHFNNNNLVKAYAIYWNEIHRHLSENLLNNNTIREKILIITYDNFCTKTENNLQQILKFCDLENQSIIEQWSTKISAPNYYKINFTKDEKSTIKNHTEETYKKLCGSISI